MMLSVLWVTLSLTAYLAVNLYDWYCGGPKNYQSTALKQEYNFSNRYKLCNNDGKQVQNANGQL